MYFHETHAVFDVLLVSIPLAGIGLIIEVHLNKLPRKNQYVSYGRFKSFPKLIDDLGNRQEQF